MYGWPKQYPDDPQKGHFLIEEAAWLLDDGSSVPLYSVKQLLIPTSEIEYVEFVKNQSEVKVDNSEIERTGKLLTDLYKKEDINADECTSKTT
ncbi:MAG TPA: hypothetical protein DEB50_08730 [Desulfobacter sp.]|nr:hypothetical protein [Desulfobacter sp.]